MTLAEWLAAPGNRASDLARASGVPPSMISGIANGHKAASLAVAIALDMATGGVIRAEQVRPSDAHLIKWLRSGERESQPGFVPPRPPGAKGYF